MIWNVMLRNLCEAHSKLEKLRERIFAQLYPDSALDRKFKRIERFIVGPFGERSFLGLVGAHLSSCELGMELPQQG